MSARIDDWASIFFSGCYPSFNVNEAASSQLEFEHFPHEDRFWKLGDRVHQTEPPRGPILVLWLYVRKRGNKATYVAKTYPDYTKDEARDQLKRIPSIQHSAEDVQRDLDPFLNEAKAYKHMDRFCPGARRIYFPRFHGVITDIDPSKFPYKYRFRRRAIVLEAIKPDISCRRILAAADHTLLDLAINFSDRLTKLPLSSFEREWYKSLFGDRLRRVHALYDIGITHGDIRDDHFRLPGDFYDTVLYDFSISYTFSAKRPYCINTRRPLPLSEIKRHEQRRVENQVYRRAEQLDLRAYLAEKLQLSLDDVRDSFTCTIDEDLDLIILKPAYRPDGFTMPSLASVFPFLEAVRPGDHLTWHIHRARQLQYYECAWILHGSLRENDHFDVIRQSLSIVSLCGITLIDVDNLSIGQECSFILVLLPRSWVVEGVSNRILTACTHLIQSGTQSGIIRRAEIDMY